MRTRFLAFPLALLAVSAAAQEPDDRRFYAAVDLGQAQIHWQHTDIFSRSDDSDTAYRLRFGYRFSPWLSAEAGYADFGEYRAQEMLAYPSGTSGALLAAGESATSAQAFGVSVVGTWPMGEHFHLNASAGLLRREFETRITAGVVNAPDTRQRDGDIATQFSVGFGFKVTEWLDVDVDWTTTDNLDGDMEFMKNRADPTLVTVGAKFRF